MSGVRHVRYSCTGQMFRPVDHYNVRWLDWEADFALSQEFWQAAGSPLAYVDWLAAREASYTYCAIVQADKAVALAAVWRYSERAWEVAAVRTREGYRRRGLGKAVVSFVTQHILDQGRLATCATREDNVAMRKTMEAVGFVYHDTADGRNVT